MYVISVANKTHCIVYVGSIGRHLLFSKDLFVDIGAIAIYSKNDIYTLLIVYAYYHAKEFEYYYYYYPLKDRKSIILFIARIPVFLPYL